MLATDAPNSMLGRRNKRNSQTEKADTMHFTSRTGIKVLLVAVGVGAVGIVADWHLAASPSPSLASPWKPDNLPRVEVVRPRRATVAQRLQTNATLEAFEEADLFAKVSGYLSDVRVDIGDHVKAGQVLAVIDVPEMKQELAEAKAQLESKRSSLESARRQLDHHKADLALQNALAKDREQLGEGRGFISDRTLDQVHANAEIAKADLGVAEANRDLAANQVDVAAATVEKIKTLLDYTQIVAPFDGVVARRQVNRGDLVQAATATRTTPSAGSLFTVQRIDTIRAFCDVPASPIRAPPATHTTRTEIAHPTPEKRFSRCT